MSRQIQIPLGIYVADSSLAEKAMALSEELDVPLKDSLEDGQLMLKLDETGLSLNKDGMELKGDFTALLPRLKSGKFGQELLVKAARIKHAAHQTVVDATAGLGEDSLLLAAAGFEVLLIERDPIIAVLLEDALSRAAADQRLSAAVDRMRLLKGNSIVLLPGLRDEADVVYLDPMFPARSKSAAVKKKFQLIHNLEAPAQDEEQLFQAALSANPKRIVVKRPLKGENLAGRKPSYSIKGKAIRYDCWAL